MKFDTRKITVAEVQELRKQKLSWQQISDKLKNEKGLNIPEKQLRMKLDCFNRFHKPAEPTQTQEPEGKIKSFHTPSSSASNSVKSKSDLALERKSTDHKAAKNEECPRCKEELYTIKNQPGLLWCPDCQKLYKTGE